MYPRLFTGVRRIEILRTSALRSSKKFACIGFSQVQSNHHEKAIASSCSSPGTCALALPSFLLGLVSLRSLQSALEPRQSLVPHILLLASAQRREHLQRLYLVLLPAEPHPGPPIGSFEGKAGSGGYRSCNRLKLDPPIGLDSRAAHRSLSSLSQQRCLSAHPEGSARVECSLRGFFHRLDTRIDRWDVARINDEPEHLFHRSFDDHLGIHSPPFRPAYRG